jgi:hypothetical protein
MCVQVMTLMLTTPLVLSEKDSAFLCEYIKNNKEDPAYIKNNQLIELVQSINPIKDLGVLADAMVFLMSNSQNKDNISQLSFAVLLSNKLLYENKLILETADYNMSFIKMLDQILDIIHVSTVIPTGANIFDFTLPLLHSLLLSSILIRGEHSREPQSKV